MVLPRTEGQVRDGVRRAAGAYGTLRVWLARVFLVPVGVFLSLMLLVMLWQLASSAWSIRALSSRGVEVEANLIARRGMPLLLPRGALREPTSNFSVSWIDTQGTQRTAPIKFSGRFAQELGARQARTVRIRYLPSDPSVTPVVIEDDGLLGDRLWDLAAISAVAALAFVLLRAVWRKPDGGPKPAVTSEPEPHDFDISPTEWAAIQASPDEALLQQLYARPHARYRIADTLGLGPASTFEAFREQVSKLRETL